MDSDTATMPIKHRLMFRKSGELVKSKVYACESQILYTSPAIQIIQTKFIGFADIPAETRFAEVVDIPMETPVELILIYKVRENRYVFSKGFIYENEIECRIDNYSTRWSYQIPDTMMCYDNMHFCDIS